MFQLAADDAPAILLVAQQARDLPGTLALVGQLRRDDEDLEAREPVDLQLEDRVGLLGVQTEALHDLRRGVGLALGLADEAQDLVERVEDFLEAFEDVDALFERAQLVLEARGDDVEPELQEVPEDLVQVQPLGPSDLGILRRHQAGEVDRHAGL